MLGLLLKLFGVSRFYSLEKELGRLKKLVQGRNAERQALSKEAELMAEIATLRGELGIHA